MKMKRFALAAMLLCNLTGPAVAQLALPDVRGSVNPTLGGIEATLPQLSEALGQVEGISRTLLQVRLDRLTRILDRNRKIIERDASGDLARKGELLLTDPAPGAVERAEAAGFTVLSNERLDTLEITVVRLAVPSGMSLAKAQALLSARIPGATISADTLSFASGGVVAGSVKGSENAMPPIATPVGVIDGGVGAAVAVAETRGFARGAPRASDHGSAVASLLRHAGVQRIVVADVYGDDPAAGNALAVARALDWLVGKEVRVVSISLVGPSNPVVARAVASAQRRGAVIVAAVGNDGPAAPPAYPASYPGVLAVTAVDGRNRALIEAGRALHLDYAAPGADLFATNAAGRRVKVRGTSFATPLVASRAALAMGGNVRARLDAEAIDLGARGADGTYGRGLLCTICRPRR